MDAETLRLLITATGVVVAGFGGALIAGFFNRATARESRVAALKSDKTKWQRDQALEHAQWVRNQKQEIYRLFLQELNKVKSGIKPANNAGGMLSALYDAREQLKIIAPASVRRAAGVLVKNALDIKNHRANRLSDDEAAADPDAYTEQQDEWLAILKTHKAALREFLKVIREDLGTDTPADQLLEDEYAAKSLSGAETPPQLTSGSAKALSDGISRAEGLEPAP